jgi:hypothetical protein
MPRFFETKFLTKGNIAQIFEGEFTSEMIDWMENNSSNLVFVLPNYAIREEIVKDQFHFTSRSYYVRQHACMFADKADFVYFKLRFM